ncbi:MAG TPA: hypothetical protein PLH94_03825 [Fimbriimonadaceae bacterium]|nr:hypothetical protein [Fimbriimonadaceae bacterium]
MDGEAPKRGVKVWIKILVLFHAFAILSWSLPDVPRSFRVYLTPDVPPALLDQAQKPIGTDWLLIWNAKLHQTPFQYYLMSTGFWQSWDMFAPNPANTDVWVDAKITFRDGTERLYPYPRMKSLSIPVKYFKERYRKFLERAHVDDNAWLRPRFAQRIALEAFEDPQNPPTRVVLRRHFRKVLPPHRVTPDGYTVVEYFDYPVDQAQLRKEAGR